MEQSIYWTYKILKVKILMSFSLLNQCYWIHKGNRALNNHQTKTTLLRIGSSQCMGVKTRK